MIIDIDMGNTRIKWRIAGESDTFSFRSSDELPEEWKALPKGSRIRISSVLGDDQTKRFCDRLALLVSGSVEVAVVKNAVAGVSLAYRDVASFGVDRWLALLAARVRHPAADCVVVHAGTALVADFLRADGQHLGGYLIGGRQAALRTLGEAAHALKSVAEGVANTLRVAPGTTTLECVEAGISLHLRGFLRELMCAASTHLTSPAWIFAGGDAEIMLHLYLSLDKAYLPEAFTHGDPQLVPGLVLDGLAVALP